jgi:membrane-bound ClpP family serine protease
MNYMDNDRMPLDRKGLYILLAGVALILLGFILMSGGGVKDPQVFNYAMFDFRRIVLAPIVIVAGIAVIIVSIVRKPKDK